MANLYLLKYNNYINRLVKKPYATIAEYLDSHDYEAFFSMNFNPNDGTTTTHTFNSYFIDFIPNYLLVENEETGAFTRWFVIEARRTRGGQYILSLKRDVLSDFYYESLNAISFISKGFIGAENPLIFNSEGVAVNQIKQNEIPLRDSTRAAWIVGYLAPNLAAEGDVNISVNYEQEVIPDIEEFEYPEYIGKNLTGFINKETSSILFDIQAYPATPMVVRYFNGTSHLGRTDVYRDAPQQRITITNATSENFAKANLNIDYELFKTVLENNISDSEYLNVLALNNKVYKDGNTYKKVVIERRSEKHLTGSIVESRYPNIYQNIIAALNSLGYTYRAYDGSSTIQIPVDIVYSDFTITFEEVGSPITSANVTLKSTIKQLSDAPYKMFCIPISDNAILKVGDNKIVTNKERMLQLANSIATQLKAGSDGFLYDLQLLPYCPIEDKFALTSGENGIEYIGEGTEHKDYDIIKDSSDTAIGYLFYCDKSSFTTNIIGSYAAIMPSVDVSNPIDFKTKNETYMFRISSPNYSNYDDFNLFKNYGINYINVDCTYKPLTPYIKLNINYKGLYGKDFNDQRGLILGGDFSLPIISDQWVNYQIQNKNYANIFERETQNLEYKHKWNMASTITGAAVGTAAGALGGAMLGNAAAGGIGAAAGGILDIIGTAATHAEDMDYRRDIYQYRIQNVQALPQGLIKTSAFNFNSRLHPFIEIYNCTAEETQIVKNKIKYSGMTLNIIGSIKDYLNPSDITYIQGKIIRININEDYHVAQELNKELNMGVYYE